MDLVLVPAGEFLMGSPDVKAADVWWDEKPEHRVRITRPFYLGATEVTQWQYQAVVGKNPSYLKSSDDLPVERVSWYDAVSFCDALSMKGGMIAFYHFDCATVTVSDWNGSGYRLPTEAEWEYACRAGSTTRFLSGDDAESLKEYAWYGFRSMTKTRPVGQKRPNAFGLYDMQGNIAEWCWDGYDASYYGRSPMDDPSGLPDAAERLVRGGVWDSDECDCRSAARKHVHPMGRDSCLGFRVVRGQSGR